MSIKAAVSNADELTLGSGARPVVRAWVLAGLLAAACAPGALAQPAAETPAPEAAALPSISEQLESLRQAARSSTLWLARRVDAWFGRSQPYEEGAQVTDGRLTLSAFHRQDEGSDVDLRFNARFRLPNAERQAYLFIGRDDPRQTVRDAPADLLQQQQLLAARSRERQVLAGVGLTLHDAVDFRLGVGSRLKPYAQARAGQDWAFEQGRTLQLRETLFWTKDELFGATATLRYEHPLNSLQPGLTVRWLNSATLSQRTRPAEWGSSLGAYQAFGGRRLFTVEALASGTARARTGVRMNDIGLLAKWEQPLHTDWLIGELQAGQFWPRRSLPNSPARAWALGASVRLEF